MQRCEFAGFVEPEAYKTKGYMLNNEKLTPLAEEMIWAWAGLNEKYSTLTVYRKNFYKCLKPNLTTGQKAKKFPEDYEPLLQVIRKDREAEKERKAQYKKDNKEKLEQEAIERKAKYGHCLVDDEEIEIPFVLEGPGILMGRGDNQKSGLWKNRVKRSDIEVNWISDKPVPEAFKGCKIVQKPEVNVCLTYKITLGPDEIEHGFGEFRFSKNSSLGVEQEKHKYEKAKRMIEKMPEIRKTIFEGIKSDDPTTKQSALICYLMMELGIRVGNEKDEDEAQTVGASTLLVKNVVIK